MDEMDAALDDLDQSRAQRVTQETGDLGVTEPLPAGPVTKPLRFVRAPGQPPLKLVGTVHETLDDWSESAGGMTGTITGTPGSGARDELDDALDDVDSTRLDDVAQRADYQRFLAENQKLTPDQQAEAIRISIATGQPISWVADNYETERAAYRAGQVDWRGIVADHPVLAEYIGDPDQAALVSDDVIALSGLEKLVTGGFRGEGPERRYIPGVPVAELRDAALDQELILRENLKNLPKANIIGGQLGLGLTLSLGPLLLPFGGQYAVARQFWGLGSEIGRDPENLTRVEELKSQGIGTGKSYGREADHIIGKIAYAPFRLAPVMAGSMAATGAGTAVGGPVGGFVAGTGFWFTQGYGPLAEQIREVEGPEGKVGPGTAMALSAGINLLTAPAMQAGPGRVIQGALGSGLRRSAQQGVTQALVQPGIKQFLGRFALHSGTEIATGALTMAGMSAMNTAAVEGSRTLVDPAARNRTETEKAQLVLGAGYRALGPALADMAILGMTSGGRVVMRDLGQRRLAIADANRLEALTEGANTSKLLGRSPEEAEKLIVRMKQEAGLAPGDVVRNVFADRERWDTYWQEKKIDPREMAAEVIGDGGKAYDEATAQRADLVIPVEKYLVRLAKTEHAKGLAADLHLAENVNTPRREAEELLRRDKRMRELAAIEPDKMEADHRRVYEDYRARAEAAGQRAKISDANARIFAAGLQTLAERAGRGETAWDLWEAHPVNILGAKGQGLPPMPTKPSTFTTLGEKFGTLPSEEKFATYYRDATTGLPNERAFLDLPPDPTRPLVAHFKIEGLAYANDKLTGGHIAGDNVYRAVARALSNATGFVAKVGGDFAGRVATEAEARSIADKANAELGQQGLAGFKITGRAGPTLKEVAKTHTAEMKALEEAGKRTPRGQRPAGIPEGFQVPRVEPVTKPIPEALRAPFEALGPKAQAERLYREEGTGLLTGEGWAAAPRKSHEITFDLNGLGFRNTEVGDAFGDETLRVAGEIMRQVGGEKFDAAHVHGDEYKAQSDDPVALARYADRVRSELNRAKVTLYDTTTHEVVTAHGTGIAYGLGKGEQAAESALRADKERLTAAGQRDIKGATAVERARLTRRPGTEADRTKVRSYRNLPGRPGGVVPGDFGPRAQGAGGGGVEGLRVAAAPLGQAVRLPQAAYHGSPHKFDRFTLEHMGTGEGMQAFGWGLYFAGEKEVAEYYRKALAPGFGETKGQLYRVNIPEDAELLSFEKTIAEQSPEIQKKLAPIMAEVERYHAEVIAEYQGTREYEEALKEKITGFSAYSALENDARQNGPFTAEARKTAKSPAEAASRTLLGLGIPGLRYLDQASRGAGEGTHNYVIWDENAIRDLQMFYQKGKPGKGERGAIEFAIPETGESVRFDIRLFDADRSTLAHESFHALSIILGEVASRLDAPAELKADYATLLKATGLVSHEERMAGHAERARLMAQETRTPAEEARLRALSAHEESGAHMWEQYLIEGRAPTAELATVFQRFKNWLRGIYNGVIGIRDQYKAQYGQDLELSDEVRGVFDRLLASKDQIAEARSQLDGPTPVSDVLPMSPEARAKYAMLEAEDREASELALLRRLAFETKAERTEWFKEEENRIKSEVELETLRDPTQRAIRFLTTGEMAGGPAEQVAAALLKDAQGRPLKLDRAEIVRKWGPWLAEQLPRGIFGGKKGEGAPAEDVAALLGFRDAEDMLGQLRKAPRLKDVVTAETRRQMEILYPEILEGSEGLAEKAMDAAHNEKHAQKLLFVMREMAKAAGGRRVQVQPESVRMTAERIISEKLVSDLQPNRYATAELAAANRAYEAAKAGKMDVALDEKEAQLFNHYLYRAARELRDQMDAGLEKLKGSGREPWRIALGKADPALRDTHDAILGAIGLGRSLGDVGEQVQVLGTLADLAQRNASEIAFDLDGIRRILAAPKPWKELQVADAKNVLDAVKSLRHFANEWNAIELEGKRMDRADFIAQAAKEAEKLPLMPLEPQDPATTPALTRLRLMGQGHDAALLSSQLMAKWLSGGRDGVFYRLLVDGYTACRNRKLELTQATFKPFVEVFESLFKTQPDRMKERIDVSDLLPLPDVLRATKANTPITRARLLMIALNMGNADNKLHMLEGYRWSEENVMRLLSDPVRGLSKAERAWVQQVWDSIESLWPDLVKVHEQDTGLKPEKVQATPLRFSDGEELRGGYFPIKDVSDVPRGTTPAGLEDAIAGIFDPDYQKAATPHSFTKSRTHRSVGITNLDPLLIPNHIMGVIHDIAFRKWTKDAAGVLLSPEMRTIMQQRLGTRRELQFIPWLQEVANQHGGRGARHLADLQTSSAWLKSKAAIQAIAWSLRVFAGDLTNPITAVSTGRLSPKYLAGSSWSMVHSPFATRRFILENSPEIRYREAELHKNLQRIAYRIGGRKRVALLSRVEDSAFILLEVADKLTTAPIWLGKYRQELTSQMRGGKSEQEAHAFAVRESDALIRDLFPAHDVAEQPSLLRDRKGLAGWFLFMGYANKIYQLKRDYMNDMRNVWKDPNESKYAKVGAVGKFAAKMAATAMVTGVLAEWASGRGPEPDEDLDDYLTRKMLGGFLYGIPIADVAVEQAYAKLRGIGTPKISVRTAPALGMIQDYANRALATLEALQEGEDDEATAILMGVETVLGFATGVPTRQAHRTLAYTKDLLMEETEPRGPADVASGLIYGERENQPSNPFTDVQSLISGE
jgi:GGDEF domain-containing protein